MAALKFNRHFYTDFFQLTKPFFRSPEKWLVLCLSVASITLTIANVKLNVALTNFYVTFYNAIQHFARYTILHTIANFILLMFGFAFTYAYAAYINGLLTIRWQRFLTQYFLQRYLKTEQFNTINARPNVDNPDQRLTEDLAKYPELTISLFTSLFSALVSIMAFGILLWQLSQSAIFTLNGWSFAIPGYLFWLALSFGLFSCWFTSFLGRHLAQLNYRQQQLNANFRYELIALRAKPDAIAAPHLAQHLLDTNFKAIYQNFLQLLQRQKNLAFFRDGFMAATYLIGLLIGIPLFLQQHIQFGGLMQISSAFSSFSFVFTSFISSYGKIAEWRAVIARLTEFETAIR